MKRRYCKRQSQAAKITVLTSGVFLIVLWVCYFKFDGIFKQSDLVPDQMPFVNYFTSGQAANSSEITDLDSPLIEGNTSQKAMTNPFGTDSNKSMDHPVTNNAIFATATISETQKPSKSLNGGENADNDIHGEVSAVADITTNDQAQSTTTIGSTAKYGESERNQNENIRDQPLTIDVKIKQTTVTIGMSSSNSDFNSVSNQDSESETFSTHSNLHASRTEEIADTTESQNVTNEMTTNEPPQTQTLENENENEKENLTNFEELSAKTENSSIDYTNAYNYHSSSSAKTLYTNASENDQVNRDIRLNRTEENDNYYKTNYPTELTEVNNTRTDRTTSPMVGVKEAAGARNIVESDQGKLETNRYVDMNLYLEEKAIQYTILLWNTSPLISIANTDVSMAECHYTNCRITTNRQLLSDSSVVVLQFSEDVVQTDIEIPQHDRDPNQVWVFQTLTQPLDVEIPESFTNTFNWSWSYRLSADIFQPYGALFKRTDIVRKPYSDIFRSKNQSAVWYSIECDIPDWIQYTVDTLRAYIKIDIYTPCNETLNQRNVNDYKFYLGFENYLCEDFITEQFFQYLDFDVVLVAFGWGHYEYLPSDIFLNASEFLAMGELGEHLAELASNEEAYTTLLKNKDSYTVKDKVFTYRNALCNLCDRLNNKEQYMRVYSVDQMYESLGKCS